jgi:type VI secretion system protein ImpG
MEELLPYYERELSHLRHYSENFARRYPKIAGHLLPADAHSDDPYIEQLVQAIAMLDARIGKKLKDDHSQCVEALLDVMQPHYLRPFPACSIAQFSMVAATDGKPNCYQLPRGTELVSRSIDGVRCRFKTAYDVTLAPLAISEARYLPAAMGAVVLPIEAAGIVSMTFESTAPHMDLRSLALRTVRAHLSGESSFIAALADGLFIHALAGYVEADGDGHWKCLRTVPVVQAGFDKSDALLEYPWKSHPAYRPLAEYFGFPEKHDFADIDLGAILDTAGACRRVTLHVAVKESHGNPHAARLLDALSAAHFRLFSTPVINLFRRPGEPIRVTHQEAAYPVVADASHAASCDIYSIDSVNLVRQTQTHSRVIEFQPIFSQRYGDDPRSLRYWFARRDRAAALASPGYETEISVIDTEFDPMTSQTDTLSLELTCTNRDLPWRLAIGLEGGDLFLRDSDDNGGLSIGAAMLRRPTQTLRFERSDALRLRFGTHLALDHLSLADMSGDALKAALVLYDLRRSAVTLRHIEAIVSVEAHDAAIELPGNPFMTTVRGTELLMTLDEKQFAGASIATFVGAINAFLGYYVQLNSFVQLVGVSKYTGEPIMRCNPRSSDLTLG